ncbi:MAG: hypothetical protein J6O04_09690 [Selenomonadaceae bacterium]|nr:hypothetical protein [Selenomonadaceae bacterium]
MSPVKLTLVKNDYPPKPDKTQIWLRIFFDLINRFDGSDEQMTKIIIAGVKYISRINVKNGERGITWLKQSLFVYEAVIDCMKWFTPAYLARMFPATKTYDGDKYECKDYFYAKATLKDHPRFTEDFSPELFCWEYWNKDLGLFAVNALMLVDELNGRKGIPSVMERFFEENDIDIPIYHEIDGLFFDQYGNFAGKPQRKIPRYLKLVK